MKVPALLVTLCLHLCCAVHRTGAIKYHLRNSYRNDLYVEDSDQDGHINLNHHDDMKKPDLKNGETLKKVENLGEKKGGKDITDEKKKYIDKGTKTTESIIKKEKNYIKETKTTESILKKEKNYVVYTEKPEYIHTTPMRTTPEMTTPTMTTTTTSAPPRYTTTNQCQVTFSIPMEQYEHICPTWEVASLRKQLVDMKFWQRNATMREGYLKKHLAREVSHRHKLQRQVTLLRQHVINMQSAMERMMIQLNNSVQEMDDEGGDNITLIVNATDTDVDCEEVKGWGVHTIQPVCYPRPIQVLCDDGWTVFMRRFNGSVDFFRDWQAYKEGFGSPDSEFWLGLDALHALTTQLTYRLVIEMTDWDDMRYYAEYHKFWIKGESQLYRAHIGNYTGNLRNSLHRGNSAFNHDSQPFSTFDKDNDNSPANCASFFHGAHWYNDCYASNLFGRYCTAGKNTPQCMVWWGHKSRIVLKTLVMKVKRIF